VIIALAPSLAHADDLHVGLYAPSARFAGTSARLDYVTDAAKHLGGTGKVYSRAGDFAAAAKKGEIDVAVVDAPYLAALGVPYTVLATATGGAWQLVSRGGEKKVADLKGKKVLCPALGGREDDFVYEALLGGELQRGFFGSVDAAPDTVSALASLDLGRADAAVVPAGADLPGGVSVVATLASVPGPALVALAGTSEAVRKKVAAAAEDLARSDVLGAFTTGGGDSLKSLAGRFTHRTRRGPMVVPGLRVTVDELVEARALVIPRIDVKILLAKPAPLPPPAR
jgi:ABC-type amino acid transport substrate-binding protein